jgi:hypothetical protein
MSMQLAHRLGHISFFDDKADVNFRRALRNHAHVNARVGNRSEHIRSDTRFAMNIFADQANDGLLIFAGHVGNLLKLTQQGLRKASGLNRKRQADFRDCHQVHRTAVAIKGLENRFEKVMNHQSSRRDYVHQTDAALRRNRAKDLASARRVSRNPRPLAF